MIAEILHRSAMMLSMKRKVAVVRTLKQARTYVLQVGICGIFSDAGVGMPNLWDVVDVPDRQPGEKGWGQKILAIWRWVLFSDQYLEVVQIGNQCLSGV